MSRKYYIIIGQRKSVPKRFYVRLEKTFDKYTLQNGDKHIYSRNDMWTTASTYEVKYVRRLREIIGENRVRLVRRWSSRGAFTTKYGIFEHTKRDRNVYSLDETPSGRRAHERALLRRKRNANNNRSHDWITVRPVRLLTDGGVATNRRVFLTVGTVGVHGTLPPPPLRYYENVRAGACLPQQAIA